MSRRITALLSLPLMVAIGAATLVSVAPASAAPLPDGATISVVDSDSGQVFDVDPATADLTPVGAANTEAQNIRGLDVDDAGKGWAVSDDGLYSADLVTGVLNFVAPVTLSDDPQQQLTCESLDLSASGVLAASCEGVEASVTGTINTATGVFTTLVDEAPLFYGLATNPVDGILYGIAGDGDVYIVDFVTGTAALTGSIVGTTDFYDADFDSAGQLWLTSAAADGEDGRDALFTVDPATWIATFVAFYTAPEGYDFSITDSITVWGTPTPTPTATPAPTTAPMPVVSEAVVAPKLAETGVDAAPLGLAGGLVLLVGVGALLLRRRSAPQR